MGNQLADITRFLADLEEDQLIAAVEEQLAAGENPVGIVDACRDGMVMIGERFAQKEYFVNDLVMSAEVFNNVMTLVMPRLPAESANGKVKAKVVIGTAEGDIHDIGKNIVVAMLRCNGFDVTDVGVDVPPEKFVSAVKETGAKVVGISGLLTTAFPSMEATVKALDEAGLRPGVKVVIGGGPVSESVRALVGADAYGKDAMEAVKLTGMFSGVAVQ